MLADDYQRIAKSYAIYPKELEKLRNFSCLGICYTALGLAGEAGEFANKVKKILRDGEGQLPPSETLRELADELGDVTWYLSQAAQEIGFDLSTIMRMNLDKLHQRKLAGTIKGSGDKR